MIRVLVHIPGEIPEVLLGLGVLKELILQAPASIHFLIAVDSTEAYEIVKDTSITNIIEVVDSIPGEQPLGVLSSKYKCDVVHTLTATVEDARELGVEILQRRREAMKSMGMVPEDDSGKELVMPYAITAFNLLCKKIDPSWDFIESIMLFSIPPYIRVPKNTETRVNKLLKTSILLEDDRPVEGSNYFVVDLDDPTQKNMVSENLYNSGRVYPIYLDDINHSLEKPLSISETAALVSNDLCEGVLSKSNSTLPFIAAAVKKRVLWLGPSKDRWPNMNNNIMVHEFSNTPEELFTNLSEIAYRIWKQKPIV